MALVVWPPLVVGTLQSRKAFGPGSQAGQEAKGPAPLLGVGHGGKLSRRRAWLSLMASEAAFDAVV